MLIRLLKQLNNLDLPINKRPKTTFRILVNLATNLIT